MGWAASYNRTVWVEIARYGAEGHYTRGIPLKWLLRTRSCTRTISKFPGVHYREGSPMTRASSWHSVVLNTQSNHPTPRTPLIARFADQKSRPQDACGAVEIGRD